MAEPRLVERLTASDLFMLPWDAVADRDGCPDVEVFAQGVRSALDDLTRSVLVAPDGPPPGPSCRVPVSAASQPRPRCR